MLFFTGIIVLTGVGIAFGIYQGIGLMCGGKEQNNSSFMTPFLAAAIGFITGHHIGSKK